MTGASRRRHRRISIALGCLGAGLVVAGALTPTAYAQAPQRVGWWNAAASSGGPAGAAAAPSPTTPPGGLRVATGPATPAGPLLPSQVPQNAQIVAYGAVLYAVPEGSSAVLKLTIAGSPQGTPQVVACPTGTTSWPAGDNQPASSEPAYDCATQHFTGTVSADATTITFQVRAQFETTPGLLSLAIVPDTTSTALPTGGAPFAVDFAPPDAGSFTPAQTEGAGAPSESMPPPLPLPFAAPSMPAGVAGGNSGAPLALPSVSAMAPLPTAAPSPVPQGKPPAAEAPPRSPVAAVAADTVKARVASALGTATLLAAIIVWSLGYGLLGGRIIPLSVPLRRE